MSIRRKLLILLLAITLIPLFGIVIFNRYNFEVVGNQVSEDIKILIEDNAKYNMQDIIQDFDQRLVGNTHLLRLILEIQANEVEKALRSPERQITGLTASTFAPDESLNRINTEHENYYTRNEDGKKIPIKVSFNKQNYFITCDTKKKSALKILKRLSSMTAQYHRLFEMKPDIIFWLHTTFENGLHTTYPAGGVLPEDFNPFQREWYIFARENNGYYISYPYVDASSRHPVLTISQPFYNPDGSFAGVVGLDIVLTHIFDWMKINPEWAQGTEAILLTKEPEQTSGDLRILTQMNYQPDTGEWNEPINLKSIKSQDQDEFKAFKEDMFSGKSGVRVFSYHGEESIWAYRGFRGRQVSPLLIVPYENFTELVKETKSFFWDKNVESIRYRAILAIIFILLIIYISYKRAKAFTKPIDELASAGKQLSDGDFNAQVNIQTGDELEELGKVFNTIGPKLKEHEKMQHSLKIAREIQQRLLPKEAPELKNFDLAGLCKYSDETGGDYYDYISFDEIESGKVSVILGDVTGHGIGAALLMASARSMLRNNIRHYAYDLSRILFEFNNDLAVDTDTDKFITLFYGLIDDDKTEIKWATGGHDPAILLKKETGEIHELKSEGIPLGFLPDMTFEQAGPMKLQKGDVVVVGTDGIWEAENDQEEMFGKERMMETVRKSCEKTSQEISQTVVDAVLAFCRPAPQNDDITIVVIKVQ